jgi:hypothetical protein
MQSYRTPLGTVVVPADGRTVASMPAYRVVEWRLCNSYQKNALSKTF